MAKDERKTILIRRGLDKGSCIPLCDSVLNYVTIDPISRRLEDRSLIVTGGERDNDMPEPQTPRPDSVAYEKLDRDTFNDGLSLGRNGRILAPLADPLLEELTGSCEAKVLTFDLDDQNANFFAQNIRKGPLGYSFELVYKPASDLGTRMINRFVPGYDKNLFVGVTIASSDINDVLNSVIAFGCASLMKVEPQHLRDALLRYAFSSRPKEAKQEVTKEDILGMREFEED